jgi:ribosomal protein L4
MCSEMQRCPLVEPALRIQIKRLKVFLSQHLVELGDRLHAFFLTLSNRNMQRRPVVLVSEVGFSAIEHESLGNEKAFLGVLREKVHYEVEHSLAVVVGFVDVSSFLD